MGDDISSNSDLSHTRLILLNLSEAIILSSGNFQRKSFHTNSKEILRTLWKSLLENLSAAILDIVDPTAYCVILAEEVANIGKKVKINMNFASFMTSFCLIERLLSV